MAARCYYPDGSLSRGGFPCANKTNGHSACCGVNQFCTSNGLCIARDLTIFRGSCTDKNWSSIDCPKNCISQARSTLAPVLPCGGGKFSCTGDCSDKANAITLSGAQITVLAAVSNSAPVGSSLATTFVTSTPGSITDSTSCSTNIGELAGVGAGIGAPLLLAFFGAMYLYMRERKRNQNSGAREAVEVPNNERPSAWKAPKASEAFGTSSKFNAELPYANHFRELEGTIPMSKAIEMHNK